MKWSRRTALIAGIALVALTNVVALGGAAYNRSGVADSTLVLTQRELRPAYVWSAEKENTGLTMQLRWRVLPSSSADADWRYYRFGNDGGGAAPWLDASKMASLGFNTKLPTDNLGGPSLYVRQLSRDALIVLELDGPAYQESLRRAADAAKRIEAKNEQGRGQLEAQTILDREAQSASRLFAVDAGTDRAALRARFPDRAKYAIVHGRIGAASVQGEEARSGVIEALSGASINVPLAMRGAFDGVTPQTYGSAKADTKHFEARVSFGQRLEPWLVSAVTK